MKHTEKLDTVLNNAYEAYQQNNRRGYYDIISLLEASGVSINYEEAHLIGCTLRDEGLVNFLGAWGETGNPHIELRSEALQYIETDSHSALGTPIINIIHSSSNANIVNNSPNTTITQHSEIARFQEELVKIETALKQNRDISEDILEQAISRIEEIKSFAETKNKIPKMGLLDLISMAGNLSSVGSLILSLKPFLPQ